MVREHNILRLLERRGPNKADTLNEIKGKIRARADVLYEDIEAVRELECFFEWAVEEAHKRHPAS